MFPNAQSQGTQIAEKTETLTVLTSNKTIIIPKIVILKPCIACDLDRQPSKIRNLFLKTFSFARKVLENFKTALFRATTKTEVFVCFDSFVSVLLIAIPFSLNLNDVGLFENRIPGS